MVAFGSGRGKAPATLRGTDEGVGPDTEMGGKTDGYHLADGTDCGGGGIWNSENMGKVAREGITHVIDMQIEFDDTPLGLEHGVEVLWNPTDDDFSEKPAELFQVGVDFAMGALERPEAKLFIHCAAGVHRAPMMALAVLGSMGWKVEDAVQMIEARRPVADFADVYVESVERFLNHR